MTKIPESIEGLPNICGAEALVERTLAARGGTPIFLGQSGVSFDRLRSACAVALHMHQPLVPAGDHHNLGRRHDPEQPDGNRRIQHTDQFIMDR